jgi:HEAT repeat protein
LADHFKIDKPYCLPYNRLDLSRDYVAERGAMRQDKCLREETASDLVGELEKLRGLDLDPEEMAQHLRPFLDRRKEAIPLLLQQFESEDEEGLAVAASALRAMDDPSLVPHLLKLLRSPHVSDLAKGLLLNLLEQYGFDVHDPSLIAASIDLRELLRGPGVMQGTE